MWSASAISRSTWTSAGHGDSDRLMGEAENHLSFPAHPTAVVLPLTLLVPPMRVSPSPFTKSAEEPVLGDR
jgi:hypothetical protein